MPTFLPSKDFCKWPRVALGEGLYPGVPPGISTLLGAYTLLRCLWVGGGQSPVLIQHGLSMWKQEGRLEGRKESSARERFSEWLEFL